MRTMRLPGLARSEPSARWMLSVILCLGLAGCACRPPKAAIPSSLPPLPFPKDAILATPANSTGAPAAGHFAVSSDGAATYKYPIWTPAGRNGVQPLLSIEYTSQSGNGILGVSWHLQGLSAITRCKRDMARDGHNAAVQFDNSDAFCLDGQRLVSFSNPETGVTGAYGAAGTEYRTEDEGFSRIINGTIDDKGPISFEVRMKDGLIFYYGTTQDSRLEGQRTRFTPVTLTGTAVQKDLSQTVRLSWSLAEVRDRFGNNLTVQYSLTGDPSSLVGYEQLPQTIRYTGTVDQSLPARRVVTFEYEDRPDVQTTYLSGLMLQMKHRLHRITLSAPNPEEIEPIKSYVLKYDASTSTQRSLLTELSECDPKQICLAPASFSYSLTVPDGFTDIDTNIHDDTAVGQSTASIGTNLNNLVTGDVDGDGCDDIIFSAYNFNPGGSFTAPSLQLSKAAYRRSSCYDAIQAESPALIQPSPEFLNQLSPMFPGAPDSNLPPVVFNPPTLFPGSGVCSSGGETIECFTQLLGVDFDLDGRTDLLSYFVAEDCGNPFPPGCDASTTWHQSFSTSVFLASSVPPMSWDPSKGLYGGQTHTLTATTTGKSIFSTVEPNSFYYHSTYVGDINGDGFPDLVQLTPDGWSFRLNHGRALLLQPDCGTAGNPCLSLEGSSPFFPGTTPIPSLVNVFVSDVFREGTASLILRDPAASNWYAAFRLSSMNCASGTVDCPVVPAPNLALVAGDSYTLFRRDWFADVNGDGLPDSLSIPVAGGFPFISHNTGNGFDPPVQLTSSVPAQAGNVALFDYDGNGTQDFVYTSVDNGLDAEAYLTVDMQGNGATQIVQLRDVQGKLGMTVSAPNGNDSYSELWSSDNMNNQGSGAIAWLPVHMDGDGKTQIAQLWNNNGTLAMIVWGPNADGSYSQIWGSNNLNDHGPGAGAIAWLPVDMQGDGRTEIVQLWSNQNHLAMIVYGPNADGSYSKKWSSDNVNGQGAGAVKWLPVHMNGDGKTQIAQMWDNNGKLGMIIWGPNADDSYSQVWGSNNMNNQGSGSVAWLPVDMQGDGRTQIAQMWKNNNKLAMIVWGPNADGSYSQVWGSNNMNNQGSGSVAWLPIPMQNDRKTQIAQLWNNNGRLAMIVWTPHADGSYTQAWGSNDMGEGSGFITLLTAGLHPGSQTRILQLGNQYGKLGMVVWAPQYDYSYSQAWATTDMASYLYGTLTRDSTDQYKTFPLMDQHGFPIRSGSNLHTFDLNGDGLTDLVQILDGDIHIYMRNGQKRDLLDEITDRGATITVSYAPLASHKTYTPPSLPGVIGSAPGPSLIHGSSFVLNNGPWVVSSYTVPRAGVPGAGPTNGYAFSYADARNDLLGRGWLGFGSVTMTDLQTHKQTITTYDNATMLGSAYPLAHRPHVQESVVTLAGSGRINRRVQTTNYVDTGAKDGSYVVVLQHEILRQEFEGPDQKSLALIRSIDTIFDHDAFGNVIKTSRQTGDGYSDVNSVSYTQNIPAWLVSLKTQSVDTSVVPGGGSETRTTAFTPDPNTGITLDETIEPSGTPENYLHISRTLDPHGVLTGATLSDKTGNRKRTSSIGSDSEGIYPSFTIDALGHTERFAVQPALGVTVLRENANHVRETRQYDSFGRPRAVQAQGGGNVSITYPSGTYPEIDVTDPGGHTSSVYSDAYQNVIERDRTAFDGRTVILLSSYNELGLVAERDGPCYYGPVTCSTSGFEQYSYDELGRLVGMVHADGSTTKTTRTNLTTTYYDELNNQHSIVQDQLGRLTQSVEITNGGHPIVAKFQYAPFGLLHSTLEPGNYTSTISYDVRGRMLALQDPDRGKHSFEWSPFGEMRESQDANGHSTRYRHDVLGRVTQVSDPSGKSEFCWDTAAHGIGMPGSSRSSDGVRLKFTYDSVARISAVTSTISGKSYEMSYGYDSVGRQDTTAYPQISGSPRFTTRQHFNSFGYLQKITDRSSATVYWQANTENERDQITEELLGNGLVTDRQFDTRGFLRNISTTGSGNPIQQLSYDYFPTGSLQSRTAQLSSSTVAEEFKYDPIDRLKEWSASTTSNATPAVTSELLHQVFRYDDLGNLRKRSILTGPGTTLQYQYGQNQAGPHAVSQVNSSIYKYDLDGNQTSGPDRTIRYTSFDLPSHIQHGNQHLAFRYDALHVRSYMREGNGDTTAYVGGVYEKRVHSGSTTHIFYVPAGGHVVAQVQVGQAAGASTTRTLHLDNLGSVQAATDPSGNVTARASYEPLGRTVSPGNPGNFTPNVLGSIRLGFTEQATDSTLQLIDMKGRIYDPMIGRFLTPDPVTQDPARSESLNPYSYAWNNPLKWVDPSGYQDDAPGPSDSSDDVSGCGTGCVEWTPEEGEVITAQPPTDTNAIVPSATADDNGSLTPPPLVAASDPGPNSCCAAASDPSEWQSFQPSQGVSLSAQDAPRNVSLIPRLDLTQIQIPPNDEAPVNPSAANLAQEFTQRGILMTESDSAALSDQFQRTLRLLQSLNFSADRAEQLSGFMTTMVPSNTISGVFPSFGEAFNNATPLQGATTIPPVTILTPERIEVGIGAIKNFIDQQTGNTTLPEPPSASGKVSPFW